MFTTQFSRNGRFVGQTAKRLARQSQQRGYATAGQGTTATTPPPPRASLLGRIIKTGLIGLTFSTAGAVGMWYLMHSNGMGFHSDEHSLLRFIPDHEEEHRAEKTINNHPLIKALREDPKYTESRPHMKMPGSYRSRSLTGGALLGPGKMVVPPYAWIEDGGKSIVSVTYLGDDLCGHPGIVHGGCLATMLDEGLARCCFGALPHNIAVTANLDINYRKPTPAGSFLVLRATTTKVEGRKAWVKGHIELLADPGEEPTILAEATGLFVSPKYAAVMPRIH